jgi:long-chain acyl-CoA synthetase
MSPRSSSPPAPPADPKGVVITHANVLANIVPVEREVLKYRKYGTPFYPLRFLNLLPLSHMFGQAMATFIPPMLAGRRVFMRGYNPVEIVGQIQRRRISVLVCVPKILDVLREHMLRVGFGPGARGAFQPKEGGHSRCDGGAIAACTAVRHEVLGLRRRRGAARRRLEKFWGELGFVVIQATG